MSSTRDWTTELAALINHKTARGLTRDQMARVCCLLVGMEVGTLEMEGVTYEQAIDRMGQWVLEGRNWTIQQAKQEAGY